MDLTPDEELVRWGRPRPTLAQQQILADLAAERPAGGSLRRRFAEAVVRFGLRIDPAADVVVRLRVEA